MYQLDNQCTCTVMISSAYHMPYFHFCSPIPELSTETKNATTVHDTNCERIYLKVISIATRQPLQREGRRRKWSKKVKKKVGRFRETSRASKPQIKRVNKIPVPSILRLQMKKHGVTPQLDYLMKKQGITPQLVTGITWATTDETTAEIQAFTMSGSLTR